jgi:hypothetical protein
MAYGWTGKLVALVPVDPDKHAPIAQMWVNDPWLSVNLGFPEYPMSLEKEKEFLSKPTEGATISSLQSKLCMANSLDSRGSTELICSIEER